MSSRHHPGVEVSEDLVEAIRSFSVRREVEHCGFRFSISPFDIYATCPQCGDRFKVRAFSGCAEIEDVFDAVFEWMNQPAAEGVADRRRAALQEAE